MDCCSHSGYLDSHLPWAMNCPQDLSQHCVGVRFPLCHLSRPLRCVWSDEKDPFQEDLFVELQSGCGWRGALLATQSRFVLLADILACIWICKEQSNLENSICHLLLFQSINLNGCFFPPRSKKQSTATSSAPPRKNLTSSFALELQICFLSVKGGCCLPTFYLFRRLSLDWKSSLFNRAH